MDQDIVLVTFNYRLGSLGMIFFNLRCELLNILCKVNLWFVSLRIATSFLFGRLILRRRFYVYVADSLGCRSLRCRGGIEDARAN